MRPERRAKGAPRNAGFLAVGRSEDWLRNGKPHADARRALCDKANIAAAVTADANGAPTVTLHDAGAGLAAPLHDTARRLPVMRSSSVAQARSAAAFSFSSSARR